MTPLVSVIICTHNPRDDYMSRVLDGLRQQSLALSQWELLLVDNHSTPSLEDRFDLSWHPNARYCREDVLGLTSARLCGVRNSNGEILVFVDDDVVLSSEYLENVVNLGDKWPFVGTWGGSVTPEYEKPLPSWVGEEVWRLTVVNVKEDAWSNLREGFATMPVGAGMCVRRKVASHFWDRSESRRDGSPTDRIGNELTGYGDMEICQCAIDIGLGNGLSTELQLTHLIPARRLTLDYFVRHAQGDAASLMLYRAARGLPITKPEPFSWLHHLRWFIHRLRRRVPPELFAIQQAYHAGILAGYELARKRFPTAAES